jgi:hypothetical protein
VGRFLRCVIRGELRVCGMSDGPIPWPIAKQERFGKSMLVVCGDLVEAIRREAGTAVMFHWGVGRSTVTSWRRALGIPATTEGTSEAKARPKRGQARPAHVVEAMAEAHRGIHHTAATRATMREARRGENAARPVWDLEDLALLGTMPDEQVALRIDRTLSAVRNMRHKLKISMRRKRT